MSESAESHTDTPETDPPATEAPASDVPGTGVPGGEASPLDVAEESPATGPRIVSPPRGGAPVPPAPLHAEPTVVRRRRAPHPSMPTLSSTVLSGRSLEPEVKPRRFAVLREHRAITISLLVVVLVLLGIAAGKLAAERAADSATSARADELAELLEGATPDDFLAFNAGVKTPGSLAEQVRDQEGFVNVKAVADLSFIRFQPSGWWAGFTERCIVATIRPDAVTVEVPKTACLRVAVPER